MSAIRSGVGLVSGINTADLVDALISLQRASVRRLEQRVKGLEATDTGVSTLEANVVSINSALQGLGKASNFRTAKVTNPADSQLRVTARDEAADGVYALQPVRRAATHELMSKGFANADTQSVGTGRLTIARGGGLHRSTLLDSLNGGSGIRRGVVRITDRSGASADIDLSAAYTVDDVLQAINGNAGVSVVAGTRDGRLVLTDTSGGSAAELSVRDLHGAHAAQDLGIAGAVAADVLTGENVYEITGDFTLDQLNDGNRPRLAAGAADVRITLSDDTALDVNLDDAASINDVLSRINDHADNGGRLSATLVDGRIELTDLSGGGGAGAFTVEDVNGSTAVRALGLDTAAANDTISGRRLAGGLNSVLLRNLRGGQGIDQPGEITLTDRTGTTATLDLSSAESLDEVLAAINSAASGDGTALQLEARVNDAGNGVVVRDTSGATAANLTIADVGGGTLAAQLGIDVDAPQDTVDSGNLRLRHVNEATSVEDYAPDGGGIEAGSIRIVDSAGNDAVVSISSSVKTVGDVLQRINAAAGVAVRAELNESGDGFVLVDEAGGGGVLRVEEVAGGGTAGDLRLLGEAVLGDDGRYRLDSRNAVVVQTESGDTLNDLVERINAAGGFVQASVLDDGSAFNASRLVLKSATSGAAGRLIVDSDLPLELSTRAVRRDALLRVGDNVETGFLVASDTNTFKNAVKGLDVDVLAPASEPVTVTVARDTQKVESTIEAFVKSYNTFVDSARELTRFDPETNQRGVLQGSAVALRVQSRLNSLVNRRLFGTDAPVRSLSDVGVRMGERGRLVFDKQRLNEVLANSPDAVADFFLEDDGFAAQVKTTLVSLTDPFTGTFVLERNALQDSVDSLNRRIEQLDEILEVRRERLLRQFINMENALGELSSQQEAIAGIAPLKINPAPRSSRN